MTRKVDRDWGRYGSALDAFKAGAGESPFARIGIAAVFVTNLFVVSNTYRVGKGHDTLMLDAARQTVRMFREGFERSAAFKAQSYSTEWDYIAYQTVARELALEMANSVAIEDAVTDRLQSARWALFTDTSLTNNDPRFYIVARDMDNVIAKDESDHRFEYLKSEPLSKTFNRTLDLIEDRDVPKPLSEAWKEIVSLTRIGEAVFGAVY